LAGAYADAARATSMTGRLHDRACLVTGSTGIGAAVATQLAAEGASVFVVSLHLEHAQALADSITRAGGRAGWAAADLTDEAEATAAVASAAAAFGRIDGLFSVAGGSGRRYGDGPVDRLTAGAFDETIALNLRSQALVCAAVVRQMLGQTPNASGTRGSILLVSSVLASHPVPELFGTHAYAAAKGGILGLATAMAAAYAVKGIRVNVIAPALVTTPMAERAASDSATVAFARRKQPLVGGFLDPIDVAHGAVYLLSDEARGVTAQVLAIDGGWSIVSAPIVEPDGTTIGEVAGAAGGVER
jgi:NAD(P)-dependent dehydrogenase (short-subunit alcohol dehydrogenase family)